MNGEPEVEGTARRPDLHRVMNLVSLAFLIASAATFAAFHFLVGFTNQDEGSRGWTVWTEIWDIVRETSVLEDPAAVIALASFFTFVVLVLCSPFLRALYRKSRVIWWLVTVMSGMATIGFAMAVFSNNPPENLRAGGICLLVTPLLNLVGLLLIRGEKRIYGNDLQP